MVLSQDHCQSLCRKNFPLFLLSLGNCFIGTMDLLPSTLNNFQSFKSQRGSNSKLKLLSGSGQTPGDSLSDEQVHPAGQGLSQVT